MAWTPPGTAWMTMLVCKSMFTLRPPMLFVLWADSKCLHGDDGYLRPSIKLPSVSTMAAVGSGI